MLDYIERSAVGSRRSAMRHRLNMVTQTISHQNSNPRQRRSAWFFRNMDYNLHSASEQTSEQDDMHNDRIKKC